MTDIECYIVVHTSRPAEGSSRFTQSVTGMMNDYHQSWWVFLLSRDSVLLGTVFIPENDTLGYETKIMALRMMGPSFQ